MKRVLILCVTALLLASCGTEAAALLSFGIRPVGIYATGPVEDDPNLKDLDLSGIAILGEAWGEIDVEKAASLRPDLVVADWWPAEKAYSALEKGAKASSRKLLDLAPIVGVAQGESIEQLARGYERLAASLGADVLYVAIPTYAPELLDFRRWGLDVMTPAKPDPAFPYWENLSWENADTYQPDLLLIDDRTYESTLRAGEKQPTWTSIRAASDKAYARWPAYWMHTYGEYAEQLTQLTKAIAEADAGLA